ncbi:MAG: hypothetical protein C0410_09355 [Anaerolinea sp.]|nr:hypothetical protein [Anaerolinea sp.]
MYIYEISLFVLFFHDESPADVKKDSLYVGFFDKFIDSFCHKISYTGYYPKSILIDLFSG